MYLIANQARCRAPRRPGGGGEEAEAALRREEVGSSVGAEEGPRREGGGQGEGGHAAAALAGLHSRVFCFRGGCTLVRTEWGERRSRCGLPSRRLVWIGLPSTACSACGAK